MNKIILILVISLINIFLFCLKIKGNKLDINLAKGVVDKMMPADTKDDIKSAMDKCANVGGKFTFI